MTDVPEGPSREAGVESGDVIVSFDGREVEDTRELVRVVGSTAVGKAVPITVFRGGEEVELTITLGRREEAEGAIPAAAPNVDEEEGPAPSADILGMTLTVPTEEMREGMELGDEAGLIVAEIDEDSEAFEKGLQQGDLITEAGQEPVAEFGDLEARIEEAREAGRKSILLLIRRGGEPRFVALSIEESEDD